LLRSSRNSSSWRRSEMFCVSFFWQYFVPLPRVPFMPLRHFLRRLSTETGFTTSSAFKDYLELSLPWRLFFCQSKNSLLGKVKNIMSVGGVIKVRVYIGDKLERDCHLRAKEHYKMGWDDYWDLTEQDCFRKSCSIAVHGLQVRLGDLSTVNIIHSHSCTVNIIQSCLYIKICSLLLMFVFNKNEWDALFINLCRRLNLTLDVVPPAVHWALPS